MRVLTWNLFHGRSDPPSGRQLFGEFAGMLRGWEWDVALLQEVPPWWPPKLAAACGADERTVLTSRNWLLPLRRAISARNPDILKANGGGSNAILVRGDAIADHRTLELTRVPERRMAHGVLLAGGTWVANLHATTQSKSKDVPRNWNESRLAADTARAWAAGAPLILGGDLNIRGRPELPGLERAGGNYVDHVFVGPGLSGDGRRTVLEHGTLSDHAPVLVEVSAA